MDNLRYSLLVFVLGIAPLTARAADPHAPADFTVSDTIVVPDAPRVGVNIQQPQFNNWTLDPNMEPMTLRHHGFATGGGSNFIENTGTAGTEDTSFEGAFGDGFFDGGTIRVYRSVSGAVQLLRTDTIVNYFASPTNGFRIELAGTGPTVEAGDLYFIDFAADNEPLSSVGPSVLADVTAVETWFPLNGAVLFRDNTTSAPENGGLTSLRISTPDAAFVGISQPRYGDVADFNESLEPGTVYRAEMWLRQQGLADGEVLFFLDPEYGDVMTTFTGVTGTWQKFTFDFVGPPRPNNPEFPFSHFLAFDGPGTVWVDNFYIYDPSHPVLAPMPETMEALGSFNPDTLRIWSAHTLSHLGTTLEEWTNPEALSLRSYDPFFGAVAGEADWKLPTILPIARDLGADPWFVMGPYLDESEWLGFMEYLAGPSGTPFGDKRVAQGQLAPWTDEFDAIYIEYSNEAWNPDPVFIWSMDAAIYGQLAEYFFQIAQSSPHFAAIQDKIRFIVNGFIVDTSASGFGQTAIAQGTSGDSLSVATYFLRDDGESFGGTEVTDFRIICSSRRRR